MCSHDEDQYQYLSHLKNLSSNWTNKYLAAISEIVYRWVRELELANYPTSVCRDDAEEDDAKNTWDEAEDSEGLGEGENTEGNVLSEHENTHVPPKGVR